jgi:hypothetical protein
MYITCTVLSVLVVHLAVATDDAEKRDVKLLPPKFVADKYGVNVGDKVNAETAGRHWNLVSEHHSLRQPGTTNC